MFYSIQEIETASPNAKITANSANSSQNKTLIQVTSSLEPRAGDHGRLSDGLVDELAKIFASLAL